MRVSRLLRIVAALAITAYVLWRSDPSKVMTAAVGADLSWIAYACALVIVDRILNAYRWWILLCAVDRRSRPKPSTVVRIFFISTFVGTFLPNVAADAYRAYSLSREAVRGAHAAASVLVDRLLGVISIVLMAAVGLLGAPAIARTGPVLMTLMAGLAGCVLACGVVFSERVAAFGRTLTGWVPVASVERLGGELIDAVRRFAGARKHLASVLTFSALVQVLRVLQSFCLGHALGIPLPLTTYFALVPIILLIMQIPVTIYGLGTAQWAFVALFGQVGTPAAQAFALSVLFVALGFVGNLPGALLYASGPAGPSRAKPADARP